MVSSFSCIHGDGTTFRHFLYATDMAEAFDVVMHKGKAGEVYNVGCDTEMSIIEVARCLIKKVSNQPFY